MSDKETTKIPSFDFDKSGMFMLAQIYVIGAAMQIDRYLEALDRKDKSKVTSLLVQFHEVSCLFEDLACICEYFKQGNFTHKMDKVWKQVRHHIRHDLRDNSTDEQSVGQTKKRHKYLKLDSRLISQLSFTKDSINIGADMTVLVSDIKEYIDWAEEIMGEYFEHGKSTGKIVSQ